MALNIDQYALLEAVGDVVRMTNPARPDTVTQSQFDVAAAHDPRYAALPRARHISRFLLQGWGDLVQLALSPQRQRESTLRARQRTDRAGWLTHEQGEFALRLVAMKLGWAAAFSPAQYRKTRRAILDVTSVSSAGSGLDEAGLVLPTEDQLLGLFENWSTALDAAGLGQRSLGSSTPPPSIEETLDRCYEAHGAQPTMKELEVFARANGIPFPRREPGRLFRDYVEAWKTGRLKRGLTVPDKPPLKRDRPDYGQDMGAGRDGERRRSEWSPDELVEWARRYLDQLPPNARPSQRGCDDWSAGKDDAPWSSAFGRAGGLSEVLRLVSAAEGCAAADAAGPR